ncbi:integrator complex subunit 1 [Tieghemostelium lacteum]|uniref:Integrator complex subunit 1 n=1 Tax=Tieghemostelium lacteum TaxID=361077 RepID=A0A151ZAP1_TIELA|nr:integrator complex subunit 1 [Tieghemostelium lacteum]|eukprot:KYQ91005.1 integrator complex subunit 1 [Tieghemostelium lacteum]
MKLSLIILSVLLVNITIVSCDYVNTIYSLYEEEGAYCNTQYTGVGSFHTGICANNQIMSCDYANNQVVINSYLDSSCTELHETNSIQFNKCIDLYYVINCTSEPLIPPSSYSQFTFQNCANQNLPLLVYSAPIDQCYGTNIYNYGYRMNICDGNILREYTYNPPSSGSSYNNPTYSSSAATSSSGGSNKFVNPMNFDDQQIKMNIKAPSSSQSFGADSSSSNGNCSAEYLTSSTIVKLTSSSHCQTAKTITVCNQ